MTLSALFAVAFSQFRLVNDLRAFHAVDPHILTPYPAKQRVMMDDRVRAVLIEQARINRQMLQVLQTMQSKNLSVKASETETHSERTQTTQQTRTTVPDLPSEDDPGIASIFEDFSDDDLIEMNRDLLSEQLVRFEASLTDADREELDRRVQFQVDQLAQQISDQPLPEEVAVLEMLSDESGRLTSAEREWRDQTLQGMRKGVLMEMYSEHSLFRELEAVDRMQLQVGE